MSTNDILWQGWQNHQAGNLVEAETLYLQVLAAEPGHVEALFRLGLVCQMQDRLADCISYFVRGGRNAVGSSGTVAHLQGMA